MSTSIIKNRNFGLLWIGHLISHAGDAVYMIALPVKLQVTVVVMTLMVTVVMVVMDVLMVSGNVQMAVA